MTTTPRIQVYAAAQGLYTVSLDSRHVANISNADLKGRWYLYRIAYDARCRLTASPERVDVTGALHNNDRLYPAILDHLAVAA